MAISKHDAIELQWKQLNKHQDDLKIYIDIHTDLNAKLFKNPTDNIALQSLLLLTNNLNQLKQSLFEFTKICDKSLLNKCILEASRAWFLEAQLTEYFLNIKSYILIKLAEDEAPPTIESMREKIAQCMDAIILHRNVAYYLRNSDKTIHEFKIPDAKNEDFHKLMESRKEYFVGLIQYDAVEPFLADTKIEFTQGKVIYATILEFIAPHILNLNFKDDLFFQTQFYNALIETQRDIEKPSSAKIKPVLSTIASIFLSKCNFHSLIMSYYFHLIKTILNNTPTAEWPQTSLALYLNEFFKHYNERAKVFRPFNELNNLQKIEQIHMNYYAHYIELHSNINSQVNTPEKALERLNPENTTPENALFSKQQDFDYLKNCFKKAISLRNTYFSKNADTLLIQDMQEIADDSACITGFKTMSYCISKVLLQQINQGIDWWYIVKNHPDTKYLDEVHNEIRQFEHVLSQYYTTYRLIINYVQQSDTERKIHATFESAFNDFQTKFTKFEKDQLDHTTAEAEKLATQEKQSKDNGSKLIAEEKAYRLAQQSKKAQSARKQKKSPCLSNPGLVSPAYVQKEPVKLEAKKTLVETLIDQGLEKIKQTQQAKDLFHKAHNLALSQQDTKGQLAALECISIMEGNELEALLKTIENHARYNTPPAKRNLKQGIIDLDKQITKLRKRYDNYHTIAQSLSLNYAEQDSVSLSKDIFWKTLVDTQNRLNALRKTGANSSKKAKKTTNIPKENVCEIEILQSRIEKHFDGFTIEKSLPAQINSLDSTYSHIEGDELSAPVLSKTTLDQRPKLKIPLTKESTEAFQYIEQFKGKHFMVGSMVLRLLQQYYNLPMLKPNDVDFISSCTDRASLIIAGFVKNQDVQGLSLYHLSRKSNPSIDLVSLQEGKDWVYKSLRSRDFHIAALSIERDGEEGIVIDATGKGIENLLAQQLTMIGNPVERLKQDPTLLLRSIKYMILGFKPDIELHLALKYWEADSSTNMEKLYADTRKCLLKPDFRMAYIYFMKQYGLLEKIFDSEDPIELLRVLAIEDMEDILPNPYSFFNPNNNHYEDSTYQNVKTLS